MGLFVMNLIEFLKEVDTATAAMSQEKMKAFIHEIARTLQEEERTDFLHMLRTADRNKNGSGTKTAFKVSLLHGK